MAKDSPKTHRNLVLYEIYVRNHGRSGSFADITADLPRIREMGVDVIWFMPIHPIGKMNKKGELGCPYSIKDYRDVNPEYGTKREFELLCQYAHALGLKVMIDVVFNHTAHDSRLVVDHPEWYHRDSDGSPASTVPEWSDVIDLVYDDPALWDYHLETLRQWVELGVDGFRCDVASIVPLPFWQRARAEIAQIKPDFIWLAESTHASFIIDRRRRGLSGWSDGELHSAFDLSYDYDIWAVWEKAVSDAEAVPLYTSMLELQKSIYPSHTIKMRCVENHDQPRIISRAPSQAQALAWTAFQAFNEGAFLIYAGQESACTRTPSLFDIDKIKWGNYSLQTYLTQLCQLKKDPVQIGGAFRVISSTPGISAIWQAEGEALYGLFNVAGVVDAVPTPLPDGMHTDLLSGLSLTVQGGEMALPDAAVIIRYPGVLEITPLLQPQMLL